MLKMEKFVSFVARESSLHRDFFPQGEEKFGSLKREFIISGVRYMEGFYEGFLRGNEGEQSLVRKIEMFVILGVRNIESSLYMVSIHLSYVISCLLTFICRI